LVQFSFLSFCAQTTRRGYFGKKYLAQLLMWVLY
jgi:hypothetical protein